MSNLKLHIAWALAVVVALSGLIYFERKAGAANERFAHAADSLAHAQAQLDSAAQLAIGQARRAAQADSQRLLALRHAQATQEAAQRALGAQESTLRGRLADSVKAAFDSLEAGHLRVETALAQERDSAISLFRGAAVARDTLAALLAASRQQTQAVSQLLAQARKKPFTQGSVFKLASLGAAFIAGHYF